MTTRQAPRRASGPTWAIWWIIPILTIAWPLIAFAHYPRNGQPGQLTPAGWIAELIWLASLATLGVCITIARHHRTAVNSTDPLGAASKHNPDVTRGQGAERHPRRKDTPAPHA